MFVLFLFLGRQSTVPQIQLQVLQHHMYASPFRNAGRWLSNFCDPKHTNVSVLFTYNLYNAILRHEFCRVLPLFHFNWPNSVKI
jgi:hypothetical protein